MLMNKYIKVSEGGLKNSMFQEPQERGDTSEKVYGILNKVIHININININISINTYQYQYQHQHQPLQLGDQHQRGDPPLRQQEIHTDANKTSSHRREGSQHFKGTRCKGTIHYCLFFLHLLKECSPIQDPSELDSTLRKDCESRLEKLEADMQVVMLASGDVLCSLFFFKRITKSLCPIKEIRRTISTIYNSSTSH